MELIATLRHGLGGSLSVAWSPGGTLAVATEGDAVAVWDTYQVGQDGAPPRAVLDAGTHVWSVAWSPGSLASPASPSSGLLAAGTNNGVLIWPAHATDTSAAPVALQRRGMQVVDLAWSPTGHLAAVVSDLIDDWGKADGIHIWSPASVRRGWWADQILEARSRDIAWSRSGVLSAAVCDHEIHEVWSWRRGRAGAFSRASRLMCLGSEDSATALAYDHSGRLAVATTDVAIELGVGTADRYGFMIVEDDEADGDEEDVFRRLISSLAFAPDGTLAVGQFGGYLTTWPAGSVGDSLWEHAMTDSVRSVAWSAGGLLAVGLDDGSVAICR